MALHADLQKSGSGIWRRVFFFFCFVLFFLRTVILVSLRIFSPMIWNLSKDRQLLPRGCFTGYHLPLLRRRKGERQSQLFTIHDSRHGLIWFKEYCSTPSERCFSRGSFELLSLRLSEVRESAGSYQVVLGCSSHLIVWESGVIFLDQSKYSVK